MTEQVYKKEYFNTLMRIGASMLMLVLLINMMSTLLPFIDLLLCRYLDEKTSYIVSSLVESAFYLFSFFFPASFFYMIGKGKKNKYPLHSVKLDIAFPLMLVGGIAVTLCAAYLNAYIVDIFDFYGFMEEIFVADPIDKNYKLILTVISTALVPAFCEEYLFRGVVLTNLMPYGKTTAVLSSAILFGLMHQNPAQILYTTVAGIVLGLVYIRTRSIWGGVIIHFFNNFLSVIEQLISDRKNASEANIICTIIELTIISVGVICIIILLASEKRRKKTFDVSGYGHIKPTDEAYTECKLGYRESVIGFFNVTNTIFVIISILTMLYWIVYALIGLLL